MGVQGLGRCGDRLQLPDQHVQEEKSWGFGQILLFDAERDELDCFFELVAEHGVFGQQALVD